MGGEWERPEGSDHMVDCGVGSEKPLEECDGTHITGSSVWNPGDQREGSTVVQ